MRGCPAGAQALRRLDKLNTAAQSDNRASLSSPDGAAFAPPPASPGPGS